MGSTVSLVAGDNVDRGPEEEEEVGGGLLWRLESWSFISTVLDSSLIYVVAASRILLLGLGGKKNIISMRKKAFHV